MAIAESMEKNRSAYQSQDLTDPKVRYSLAYKRMKRIKSFYIHLAVYLIMNTIIIVADYSGTIPTQEFWSFETFSLAVYWGIGILFHAFSVFGKQMLFSADWEERKIQELMKQNDQKNKWE